MALGQPLGRHTLTFLRTNVKRLMHGFRPVLRWTSRIATRFLMRMVMPIALVITVSLGVHTWLWCGGRLPLTRVIMVLHPALRQQMPNSKIYVISAHTLSGGQHKRQPWHRPLTLAVEAKNVQCSMPWSYGTLDAAVAQSHMVFAPGWMAVWQGRIVDFQAEHIIVTAHAAAHHTLASAPNSGKQTSDIPFGPLWALTNVPVRLTDVCIQRKDVSPNPVVQTAPAFIPPFDLTQTMVRGQYRLVITPHLAHQEAHNLTTNPVKSSSLPPPWLILTGTVPQPTKLLTKGTLQIQAHGLPVDVSSIFIMSAFNTIDVTYANRASLSAAQKSSFLPLYASAHATWTCQNNTLTFPQAHVQFRTQPHQDIRFCVKTKPTVTHSISACPEKTHSSMPSVVTKQFARPPRLESLKKSLGHHHSISAFAPKGITSNISCAGIWGKIVWHAHDPYTPWQAKMRAELPPYGCVQTQWVWHPVKPSLHLGTKTSHRSYPGALKSPFLDHAHQHAGLHGTIELSGSLPWSMVQTLWPRHQAVAAQNWLRQGVTGATLKNPRIHLMWVHPEQTFHPRQAQERANIFKVVKSILAHSPLIQGSFDLDHACVRFLPSLSPVCGVQARAAFTQDHINLQIRQGMFQHHRVTGNITINPLTSPEPSVLHMDLGLQGPFAHLMPTLLVYAQLPPAPLVHVQGTDHTRLVGTIPLIKNLRKDQVALTLTSKVKNGRFDILTGTQPLPVRQANFIITSTPVIQSVVPPRILTSLHPDHRRPNHPIRQNEKNHHIDLARRFPAISTTILVKGTSLVSTMPTTWTWDAAGIKFRMHAQHKDIARMTGIDISAYINAPITFVGHHVPGRTVLRADLTTHAAQFPLMGWRKNPGQNLALTIDMTPVRYTAHLEGMLQGKAKWLFWPEENSSAQAVCPRGPAGHTKSIRHKHSHNHFIHSNDSNQYHDTACLHAPSRQKRQSNQANKDSKRKAAQALTELPAHTIPKSSTRRLRSAHGKIQLDHAWAEYRFDPESRLHRLFARADHLHVPALMKNVNLAKNPIHVGADPKRPPTGALQDHIKLDVAANTIVIDDTLMLKKIHAQLWGRTVSGPLVWGDLSALQWHKGTLFAYVHPAVVKKSKPYGPKNGSVEDKLTMRGKEQQSPFISPRYDTFTPPISSIPLTGTKIPNVRHFSQKIITGPSVAPPDARPFITGASSSRRAGDTAQDHSVNPVASREQSWQLHNDTTGSDPCPQTWAAAAIYTPQRPLWHLWSRYEDSPDAVAPCGHIALALEPLTDQRTRIQLDVTNAGEVLASLGWTQALKGGHLNISAVRDSNGHYDGTLHGQHITWRSAALAQLLTLISPTMLTDLFSSGTHFYTVKAQWHYAHPQLIIHDSVARGLNLGLMLKGSADLLTQQLTMKGVFIPSYFLNTAFQIIPGLGLLFGGKKGLVSGTFDFTGSWQAPHIGIHPLSFFKIGMIRNVVKAFKKGLRGKSHQTSNKKP